MADNYTFFAISEIFCIFCCCRTLKEAAEDIDNNSFPGSELSKSNQYDYI